MGPGESAELVGKHRGRGRLTAREVMRAWGITQTVGVAVFYDVGMAYKEV